MTLRKLVNAALLSVGFSVALTGCSRDRIEAINLANEGDGAVKVNVEGAIQKYEQAVQLDPSNHLILAKLATAYEKKEDWDKMGSTLSRAVQLAPDFASYWFKRGRALIAQAEGGNPDAYEQAKEPLQKCIEKDPNFAECYHLLGEAQQWTGDEQSAADSYTKAIEHDSSKGYFYPPLAELYITYRLSKEAEQVATEGLRVVPPTEKNVGALYNMCLLLGQSAQLKGDKAALLAAMQRAEKYVGDEGGRPDAAFNLGSTYAVMDPPQKEAALRLLNLFTKRACRGGSAAKWKEQCAQSASLIQKLGQ